MNTSSSSREHALLNRSFPALAGTLAFLLLFEPAVAFVANAQKRPKSAATNQKILSENQRIAHVLSRLTFGARPGDFERVKAMGVEAFIAQQLDSDSLDDNALQAKLGRLPTLGMATPVLIEQYKPPKPGAAPSPTPAQLPALNSSTVQSDMKNAAAKTDAGTMAATPAGTEMMTAHDANSKGPTSSQKPETQSRPEATPEAKPKPTPPPKNPQMIVTELQRAALLRAVYSERQLFEVMVRFWENHFSVNAYKDDDRYLITSYDRDTIRPFALGRFRDLLGATAHSPAMLFYLDNWRSSVARPYAATKDKPAGVDGGLNENYARELLELHTMGVDGGYTQQDVQEVARCFSGWTIQKPNEEGLFLYRPGLHDKGEKTVLGHKIAAGGIADGERVLDILASHPATAHFIATKLARRFISDNPPETVIDRAAAVFLKTDGSIRETLRAIVSAPEFSSPIAYRAKIRTPFEYVAAALRALNAETDIDPALADWTKRMGEQAFGRITPDGYPDRAEQWLSAGAMLTRFNFAIALASNKIKGTHFDSSRVFAGVDGNDAPAMADRLTQLVAGDVSRQTRGALETGTRKVPTLCGSNVTGNVTGDLTVRGANYLADQNTKTSAAVTAPCLAGIAEVITIAIGSPEFQRR